MKKEMKISGSKFKTQRGEILNRIKTGEGVTAPAPEQTNNDPLGIR
jgi:hypothetical protein